MLRLSDLLDVNELGQMIDAGYIGIQQHPTEVGLLIFNYTHAAQYDRVWNKATRACRGLIVRVEGQQPWGDGTVVARPWPKFFNYGELEWENPVEASILLDTACTVTDKLDGSLGILYPMTTYSDNLYTGEGDGLTSTPLPGWAISTRGSFTSEQALHATEVLRTRYADFEPNEGVTYLFEIIYPANRIVVDYKGLDDLVLLGAVEIATGKTLHPHDLQPFDLEPPQWYGPVAHTFDAASLRDALTIEPRPNAEGIVVRFDTGEMLKIKQQDYVELHRIVTGLNERTVWERLGRGEAHADICAGLPDEFEVWVKEVGTRLILEAALIESAARDEHNEIVRKLSHFGREWTRKEYAERAAASPLRPYLFLILDGKDMLPAIWREIKPSGVSTPRSFTEATA